MSEQLHSQTVKDFADACEKDRQENPTLVIAVDIGRFNLLCNNPSQLVFRACVHPETNRSMIL